MADNDNNDEYHLEDMDLLAVEPDLQFQPEPAESVVKDTSSSFTPSSTLRNGLIAVGCIIVLMFSYKFIGSFISGNQSNEQAEIIPVKPIKKTVITQTTMTRPLQTMLASTPQEPPLSQKLSKLEQEQKNMSSDVSAMNTQLSGVNTTMNTIATKMAELNGLITALNAKIEMQSQEIERLHEASKPKVVVSKPRVRKLAVPGTTYAIQAVIPGRAWLIASNGMTLTVREGTRIAGYGVVKLVDAKQGRVLTSSGQIIRFSQTDS